MTADYQNWLNFYQQNLGRFLKMPLLGVARESMAQMTAAADAYNQFMLGLADFAVKFGIPFQTALNAFGQSDTFRQAEAFQKTDADSQPGTDDREGAQVETESPYDQLVRLLDKAYDDYLKSPEGVQAVADLISLYLAYEQKARAVREIGLKAYGLPTPKEMDQAHKEIHRLKKALRAQNQVLAAQNEAIVRLQSRMDALGGKPSRDTATTVSTDSDGNVRLENSKGSLNE